MPGCLLAQGISRTWETLGLDLAEHKGTHRVRGEPFRDESTLTADPRVTP